MVAVFILKMERRIIEYCFGFEALGKNLTIPFHPKISKAIQNSCPGAGACGETRIRCPQLLKL
jgi:hypothetical protein